MRSFLILIISISFFFNANGQQNLSVVNKPVSNNKEELAVLELGGSAGGNFKGGTSLSPSFAVEITPIENWLELEAGTTPIFGNHSTSWESDFLFKKPWTFSPKVEFMVAVGSTWTHTSENSLNSNVFGAEFALDFMYWFSSKHKLGLFLEPAYQFNFGQWQQPSYDISGGLLIAIH